MITTIVVDADSLAVACGTVDYEEQVRYAVDNKIKKIQQASGCTTVLGFVENWKWKQNFRKHVSVSRTYKDGRGEKPQHTDAAKAYLVHKWGFGVATYVEAEDCVACKMHELGLDKCYGAAIDKDVVRGCPGSWYNYKKEQWVTTTYEDAERFMYYQILVGDGACDNIPGCPGVGPKTAKPIIDGCEALEQLPLAVAEVYKTRKHPYAYLLEQSRLIRIRRSWDEPPFTPITKEAWDAL
jgi:hypothetical protein